MVSFAGLLVGVAVFVLDLLRGFGYGFGRLPLQSAPGGSLGAHESLLVTSAAVF